MATSGKKHWPPMGRTQWPLTADVAELLWEAAFVLYEQPAQKASMRAARKARHDAARSPRAAS